jgi:peptidoglycan/xylan/chitin deacetylase (PgdA/CDA1 family)
MVSFNFADGIKTQYTETLPMFNTLGIVGSTFVITDNLALGGSWLSIAQALEMQTAGWEVGSHSVTHRQFSTLTEAEIIAECVNSKSILEGWGFNVKNFVYPWIIDYSDYTIRKIVENTGAYRSARTGIDGLVPMWNRNINFSSLYALSGIICELTNDDLLTAILAKVDEAYASNEWLTLTAHTMLAADTARYTTLVNYIKSLGIPILTTNQALDKLQLGE